MRNILIMIVLVATFVVAVTSCKKVTPEQQAKVARKTFITGEVQRVYDPVTGVVCYRTPEGGLSCLPLHYLPGAKVEDL